jgi:hypothetical protein
MGLPTGPNAVRGRPLSQAGGSDQMCGNPGRRAPLSALATR